MNREYDFMGCSKCDVCGLQDKSIDVNHEEVVALPENEGSCTNPNWCKEGESGACDESLCSYWRTNG